MKASIQTYVVSRGYGGMLCLLAHSASYEERTDTNLCDRIRSEMSGPLERLCVRLVTGPRGGVTPSEFNAESVGMCICLSGVVYTKIVMLVMVT